MVCIRKLSSIALVSILTLNSGAALSKGLENAPISNASAQTEPLKMANIFRTIQRINQTANQERLREERRQQAEERKRQQEIARQEALEKRRLEVERRRQYFESLSPEQQQAYIKEQRAAQARRDEAAAAILMMIFSNSSSSNQQDSGGSVMCLDGYDSNGNAIYRHYPRSAKRDSRCS